MSQFLDLIFEPSEEVLESIEGNIARLRALQKDGAPLPNHAFQLAIALISHTRPALVREGVVLLESVSFQLWQDHQDAVRARLAAPGTAANTVSRDSDVTRLSECCFYLAIGQAKLGDSVKARSSVEKMLSLSPGHPQGVALMERLDQELFQSGVKGVMGLAVAVIGAGIALATLRRR